MYAPVNQVFQTYGLIEGAKAGLKRCLELIDIEPDIKDRPARRRSAGRAAKSNSTMSYSTTTRRARC